MKKFALLLLTVTEFIFLQAQNVGIGTTSPNASAQLDVASTTKGLLMPRMTSAQRTAIASPVAGLMVYDTDRKLFYQHDGSTWRLMLNNDFWNRATTSSNYIVNLQDSIGIGTTSPNERLDVNGNIRARNNLLADDNIIASGGLSGATISTPGNLTVAGTSFFSGNVTANSNLSVAGTSLLTGDVTTNSDLILNNTAATIQLKSSSVNKGFFQLSGDDVRFGTNSGNSTGNLIIRMNGNNRITVNPSGDIDLDGKVTRSTVTGTNSLVPVCYGLVQLDGSILSGTGNFTVSYTGGKYVVTCNDMQILSVIIVTPGIGGDTFSVYQPNFNTFEVRFISTVSGNPIPDRFYFVVFKPS